MQELHVPVARTLEQPGQEPPGHDHLAPSGPPAGLVDLDEHRHAHDHERDHHRDLHGHSPDADDAEPIEPGGDDDRTA